MGTLSPIHWILVAIVVLLVFGPKSLSKIGRNVGQGLRSVNNLKEGFGVGDPIKALTRPLPAKKRPVASTPPASAEQAEPAAPAESTAPAAAEKPVAKAGSAGAADASPAEKS